MLRNLLENKGDNSTAENESCMQLSEPGDNLTLLNDLKKLPYSNECL